MSKLFGSKARPVTQPTGFETLPQFARSAFEQAVEQGQGIPTSAFAPAGLTGQQQSALGTLQAGLGPTSPQAFQTGLETFGNPFEEQVVQSALADLQRTGRGVLSDIGAGASAAGGFGGTRQAVLEAELGRGLGQEAGALSGRLRSQGFQAAADRTLGDIARSQALAPTLFGLGDIQRQIQTQQQQAPIAQAQFLASLAGNVPGGGGQVSFQQQPGFLQRFGQGGQAFGQGVAGFGSGLAGLGGGAAAFSDRRLKENIKQVGIESGFNIYEFNYKYKSGRYRGVIAQEVIKIRPDAVKYIGDYMAVKYDDIGLQMVRV